MHSMLPLSPHPQAQACHHPSILSQVSSPMLRTPTTSPVRSAVFQGADAQAISLLSVDMPPRRAFHVITLSMQHALVQTLDGVTSPTLARKRRSSTTTHRLDTHPPPMCFCRDDDAPRPGTTDRELDHEPKLSSARQIPNEVRFLLPANITPYWTAFKYHDPSPRIPESAKKNSLLMETSR